MTASTVQTFNFAGKAEDLATALEDARNCFEQAVALACEIADAAGESTGDSLVRVREGVAAEARSLQGYINDMFPSLELENVVKEGNDLQALVKLALAEAVAS